ncbi:PREDICTED: octopamine receptor 1-like [Priapulus caudatus]|uniref:Octopamine receptor 1-like n=1 Tax=Priapulus caudatus TaxID=37621 RepID=A0ABM1ETD3_PRICU|nr:PREDICTED: octopamine receptor 1-like [Priapulus caudatus]
MNQSSFAAVANATAVPACETVASVAGSTRAALSLAALIAIDGIIVAGNALVIAAVIVTKKLHTVTNRFIVSLAVADLLMGVAVLPYSLTLEVLEVWVFGNVWCRLWLAIDVLLCTASIINLCAISLDRYLAITKPIGYPTYMSSSRGKLLIVAVWISAFLICIPPLLGWNEDRQPFIDKMAADGGAADGGSRNLTPSELDCELIKDRGYRIYSALGSFYIPCSVMCFFYWRIYVAATRSSKAMKRGFKEVAGGGATNTVLRIHRGGGNTSPYRRQSSQDAADSLVLPADDPHCKATKSPSATTLGDAFMAPPSPESRRSSAVSVQANGNDRVRRHGGSSPPQGSNGRRLLAATSGDSLDADDVGDILHGARHDNRAQRLIRIRKEFRKFTREMKAAKTLAVIVGVFILCWLPFFTIYFIGAFCEHCTPPVVFSVCFWLGYCNSALNPAIYAMFSKDYRYAFKRILRCGALVRARYSPSGSAEAARLSIPSHRDEPLTLRTPSNSNSLPVTKADAPMSDVRW